VSNSYFKLFKQWNSDTIYIYDTSEYIIDKIKIDSTIFPQYSAHGKKFESYKHDGKLYLKTDYFDIEIMKYIEKPFHKFKATSVEFNENTLVYFDVDKDSVYIHIYDDIK
jgi:hypothetical protein